MYLLLSVSYNTICPNTNMDTKYMTRTQRMAMMKTDENSTHGPKFNPFNVDPKDPFDVNRHQILSDSNVSILLELICLLHFFE